MRLASGRSRRLSCRAMPPHGLVSAENGHLGGYRLRHFGAATNVIPSGYVGVLRRRGRRTGALSRHDRELAGLAVRLGKLPHRSDVRERCDTEQRVLIARPMHLVRNREHHRFAQRVFGRSISRPYRAPLERLAEHLPHCCWRTISGGLGVNPRECRLDRQWCASAVVDASQRLSAPAAQAMLRSGSTRWPPKSNPRRVPAASSDGALRRRDGDGPERHRARTSRHAGCTRRG